MEKIYTAYIKEIDGISFYFIKKYTSFPEYKDIPDIMESYGMHKDFNRACGIALVNDNAIRQELLNTLPENQHRPKIIHIRPKIIHMNVGKIINSAVRNTQQALFKLKVAGHR